MSYSVSLLDQSEIGMTMLDWEIIEFFNWGRSPDIHNNHDIFENLPKGMILSEQYRRGRGKGGGGAHIS